MQSEPAAPAVAFTPAVDAPADRVRPDLRMIGLLSIGHLVLDINGGALPALLPFLRSALNLSYTATGAIVLMANITSSLIQPVFGYLADKTARRWLLPVSIFLSALGIALTGLATSYAVVLALVIVSGFGIAAYHPEGYRTATQVAGDRKATAVSIFSAGGNIGIAAGPPLITALVTGFGLPGTLGLLVPSVLIAALLTAVLPRLTPAHPDHRHTAATRGGETMVGAMLLLIAVVALRSWTQIGFSTFVPFYYIDVLKGDPRMVGTLLAVFLGAGVAGSLVAGPVADRIGLRRFMLSVFLLAIPLAVLVLFVRGVLLFVVLALLGFVLVSTFTITVVLAQAYMPRNLGMASGLIVGFAIGTGGLGATLLGWAADHWGLMSALWISALMPLPAFMVSLLLPEPNPRHS